MNNEINDEIKQELNQRSKKLLFYEFGMEKRIKANLILFILLFIITIIEIVGICLWIV